MPAVADRPRIAIPSTKLTAHIVATRTGVEMHQFVPATTHWSGWVAEGFAEGGCEEGCGVGRVDDVEVDWFGGTGEEGEEVRGEVHGRWWVGALVYRGGGS
jgi:hypothetical protein